MTGWEDSPDQDEPGLDELAKILKDEVLDIWQVADLTGMKRTSIHTYLVRPKSDFPRPVWESAPTDSSGSQKRHPTRLWSRTEVEEWVERRTRRPE